MSLVYILGNSRVSNPEREARFRQMAMRLSVMAPEHDPNNRVAPTEYMKIDKSGRLIKAHISEPENARSVETLDGDRSLRAILADAERIAGTHGSPVYVHPSGNHLCRTDCLSLETLHLVEPEVVEGAHIDQIRLYTRGLVFISVAPTRKKTIINLYGTPYEI